MLEVNFQVQQTYQNKQMQTNYNTKRRRFPTNIIASLFGFQEKPLYKASDGASEVPSVDFSR